jgi:hypothetical protein
LERAAWLREQTGKVAFAVNDTRELVVATLENSRLYGVRQLPAVEGDAKVTTRVELTDTTYDVHVRLNAELENKTIRRAHLICERAMDGAGIRLVPAYRWRADRLGEFKNTAYDLFDTAIGLAQSRLKGEVVDPEAEEKVKADFQQWQNQVAEFLTQRWDDVHKQRFLPDPPKPRPDAPAWVGTLWQKPEPPELHSRILAKTKILDDFQNELMREPLKELAIKV